MPESAHSACPVRRALAAAVGLFASWQLIYLPAANLIDLVPRRLSETGLVTVKNAQQAKGTFTTIEPLQRVAECAGDSLDFWSEVTGEEQGWSLFTPGPPPYAAFPAVEFRFADGTGDTLLSPFEPLDKRCPPIRLPLVDNRLLNFEAQLAYPVWYLPPEEIARLCTSEEEVAKLKEFYRSFPEVVWKWRKPIRAWLAWRLKQYREAHPERGVPTEVILKHRFILSPRPDEPPEWTRTPAERPFARWLPASDALEAYDAVGKRFVPLEAKP